MKTSQYIREGDLMREKKKRKSRGREQEMELVGLAKWIIR